ncbi:leucyl/phenylalanyl-tRNA--protein transferase [Methylosinus sporium]|uniref:Leucyl/phenylalanyl-tRNA--protein transferase n=1 Tax=Methylosinus sporium TaxID=428 RepID=A0A2U1ST11_METSR|nr:leucyl/phenylalanyl-tRNA--protein transferase [Methylosinus sporium]PWB94749.1 leucyl/phenylalanyl-tRNA--protein transferase [Methylosinus sporium]
MSRPSHADYAITPQILLRAYSIGLFPMAESADEEQLFWVDPQERAIFPLDAFKVSRSLAKTIRSDHFEVRVDTDFDAVIAACAASAPKRENTWINSEIKRLYRKLFDMGFAHTVECWREGRLVGGLYGVSMRAAFFGESMFHVETDASKVALAHLVARLVKGGFRLLDTQFITTHLASLGAIEIGRDAYHGLLEEALSAPARFAAWPDDSPVPGREIVAILRREPEIRTEKAMEP